MDRKLVSKTRSRKLEWLTARCEAGSLQAARQLVSAKAGTVKLHEIAGILESFAGSVNGFLH